MNHTLENQYLRVTVREQGAELDSIFHQQHRIEYLWQADPTHWAKKSPVLFPIVGSLKDGTYFHNGQAYRLPRHGFARERAFALVEQTENSLFFAQNADNNTRKVYPFEFRFGIRYQLVEDTLSVTYEVANIGDEVLYFSVGGHPAFNVPLAAGTHYEDYRLVFDQPEKL
nr:aldose 1-epimerase family protein [Cytophagales bacterium]